MPLLTCLPCERALAPAPLAVLTNDTDAEGDALSATLAAGPAHGLLTLNADGSFSYTPDAGYLGADSFTYRAVAGSAQSNVATVQLEVVNVVPEAPDTQYQVNAGEALEGELSEIASDRDLEDDLHFVLDASPAHGTLSYFRDDGTFAYQPDAGFLGEDFFTYHVADGAQASTVGKVVVRAVGRAPVAVDISYDVAMDGELTAHTARLLTRDAAYDLNGDTLTAKLVTGPSNAAPDTFQLNADGTFRYKPAASFEGEDSFTFTVSDGGRTSKQATVKLLVSDHPVAHDDVYLVPSAGSFNEPLFRGPLSNDFFPTALETDEKRIALYAPPSSGTVEIVDGTWFIYTPSAGQPMPNEVTFTYRAELWTEDGWLYDWSEPATVRLLRQPAAPKVTLAEEALSKGALAITKDKGDGTYRTGWRPGDKGPQAVAFVAGGKTTLVAQFQVDKPELLDWRNYPIWGDNPLLTPAQWDSKGVVLDQANKMLTVTWQGARVGRSPLASLDVKQHWRFGPAPTGVGILGPRLNFPAADFLSVGGTSEYNLYTLDAKPVNTPKLYHTLAAIGTKAAQQQAALLQVGITFGLVWAMRLLGENWTPQQFQEKLDAEWAKRRTVYGFEDSIKRGVMAAFSNKEITDAKTKATNLVVRRADDRRVLNYYGVWLVAHGSKTTEALLKNADGMCDAWARFFVGVLRAQGIDVRDARRLVFPKADLPLKRGNYWMYVKSWKAADTSEDPKMKPFIKSRNRYSIPAVRGKYPVFLNMAGHSYRWVHIRPDTEEQVKKQAGLVRGQGMSNNDPQATFLNHVLVELRVTVKDDQQPKGKTVVFDPSYGMQHDGVMRNQGEAGVKADSDVWLLTFQQTALDFVGLHLEAGNVGGVRFRDARETDSLTKSPVLHLSWDTLIDSPKKR